MGLKAGIARKVAAWRVGQIYRRVAAPEAQQRRLLRALLERAVGTAFGRDHGFGRLQDYHAFRQAVPVRDYEDLRPFIDRVVAGEPGVLWPGRPLYLAKTSGTTSGTKYIPLTQASMPCHVRGARDALLCYIYQTGRADFLEGKMMFLSGSPALETNDAGLQVGRLSGIAQHYVPAYLQRNRVPTFQTNCLEDWEAKVAAIVRETVPQDLRLISGIPPWVRMFLEQVTAQTGKKPAEVWPNLHTFIQGGVDYRPYAPLITEAMGRRLDVVEVYPASEGFIAVQDLRPTHPDDTPGLLLMLDYGIFYEFIPLSEYGRPNATRLPLWEVQPDVPYAILLTTNAGLWAYDIGDVVTFTGVRPYRLRVSGRVKHFISAFGEHVIESEVNAALLAAVAATGAEVAECTVAPCIGEEASYHEWWIEFLHPPVDMQQFRQVLDDTLRQRNTYYDDLRAGEMLTLAEVVCLQRGAANRYMESLGRLGGQNKFPRLSNHREVVEGLRPYILLP